MPKFKVGDKVNFHTEIGGPVTSTGYRIEIIQEQPNIYGCDVARITRWVALDQLSLMKKRQKSRV